MHFPTSKLVPLAILKKNQKLQYIHNLAISILKKFGTVKCLSPPDPISNKKFVILQIQDGGHDIVKTFGPISAEF